jgi:ATP-binding cassette subfamily B (MDR/TAP) protein 1
MLELCDRLPAIDGLSLEGKIPDKPLSGDIHFKDITFSYPSRPDIRVCKNYNLDIKAGEIVALCGASGSGIVNIQILKHYFCILIIYMIFVIGKSTCANLLLRFYDPQEGELLLDGINLKEYNTRWIRSQIGYVGQEPYLFSGTIADNIADGLDTTLYQYDEKTKLEKIQAAAKLSNAHDFIMSFPLNYNTDVGSNGVSLR